MCTVCHTDQDYNLIFIVGSLGFTDLVPYYLPTVTSLMLVIRCHQINQRNKR